MKKTLLSLIVFLAACASVSNYPITLTYQPLKHHEKTGAGTIAVAMPADKRTTADKRLIGMKDDGIKFISLIDEPSTAVAKAFGTYLENRGYTVNAVNEVWDGDSRTIKSGWGDLAVGGFLEDLSISVKSRGILKTEYICSVKLFIIFADVRTEEIRHKERFEVSTSYVTVTFSREKAEELINNALSDIVERSLADAGRYLPKK